MHEASAAEALVRIVSEEADRRGAGKVLAVNLVVGEATGFMEESLAFYVGILARGTPVEGAALKISYVKPRLRCPGCGILFERSRFSFACPSCGTTGEATRIGSEFYVDTIEIDGQGEAG